MSEIDAYHKFREEHAPSLPVWWDLETSARVLWRTIHEANPTPKPKHVHECERCKYLGTVQIPATDPDNEGTYDLYACESRTLIELIARYSDDGPDYLSTSFVGWDEYSERMPRSPVLAFAWVLYRAQRGRL